jgi:putative transposase
MMITMRKQHIELRQADKRFLQQLLKKGSLKAIVFKRATALLQLDSGETLRQVWQTLGVSYPTALTWRDRYLAEGLAFLQDKPRSGRPVEIPGSQRAHMTALACSTPPEGRARWTLRLLADKAVELGHCQRLSHTQARHILKKMITKLVGSSPSEMPQRYKEASPVNLLPIGVKHIFIIGVQDKGVPPKSGKKYEESYGASEGTRTLDLRFTN